MSDEEIIEFALGLTDTLKRAEALQVGTPHVGDESAGGLGSLYQRLDVARVRGSHLHDGDVVLVAQAEQGLGHAHVVVEVALRRHHVVALGEDGTDEFLGGRLAVGARDADDGDVELPTVLPCQVLVGLQTVVNRMMLSDFCGLWPLSSTMA